MGLPEKMQSRHASTPRLITGGSCFVVAEMSHPGATEFFYRGTAEKIARLAIECGADGIIAPATRPERVKVLRGIVGKQEDPLSRSRGTGGRCW